jgi:hypothetical protein
MGNSPRAADGSVVQDRNTYDQGNSDNSDTAAMFSSTVPKKNAVRPTTGLSAWLKPKKTPESSTPNENGVDMIDESSAVAGNTAILNDISKSNDVRVVFIDNVAVKSPAELMSVTSVSRVRVPWETVGMELGAEDESMVRLLDTDKRKGQTQQTLSDMFLRMQF